MDAAKLKAIPPRRRSAMSGARLSLTPLSLALCCAALAACATTPQPTPVETPPRIGLSQGQREGAGCNAGVDGLRGRLPSAEALTVSELGSQWIGAEARAACWRRGYFELVGIADVADAAWEDFANGDD